MKRKNMILVGPAGCGKTTNAAKIATVYGLKHYVEAESFKYRFTNHARYRALDKGSILFVGEPDTSDADCEVIQYPEAMERVNSWQGKLTLLLRKQATPL